MSFEEFNEMYNNLLVRIKEVINSQEYISFKNEMLEMYGTKIFTKTLNDLPLITCDMFIK